MKEADQGKQPVSPLFVVLMDRLTRMSRAEGETRQYFGCLEEVFFFIEETLTEEYPF